MGRTQERLASGKKVNSALDNPTNFFTAKSHTSRANDLLGFKDAISEAIQTIKAADNTLSSITAMLESAKAVAEDAKGALGSAANSQTLTINTLTGMSTGQTVVMGGNTFTAVVTASAASSTQFYIGGTTAEAAISLAQAINESTETKPISATVSGNVLTISPTTAGSTTMLANDIAFVAGLASNFTESSIGSGTELANKVSSFTTMLSQLDDLKSDGFYKGKNLLNAEVMTVRFGNDHTLDVTGFQASSAGLGITHLSSTWVDETTIQASIDDVVNAIDTLKTQGSALASTLSIVQTRSDWITNIAAVLQTGADNLVNADTNEEGANMLMLQTRQSLSTSALSMAAQSAQSVLRLFQ
jgi:flagellin-like hook-associated protein FlgL